MCRIIPFHVSCRFITKFISLFKGIGNWHWILQRWIIDHWNCRQLGREVATAPQKGCCSCLHCLFPSWIAHGHQRKWRWFVFLVRTSFLYLYFHHIYLITFNRIFLKFRVESTCFKSWTFMPLLVCPYYGFASLKRLPSPGFMALIDLQGTSKVWPEANHIFFGIFAGHALLPLSWQ